MNCLVTGATGFVGHRLTDELLATGHSVRAMVRSADRIPELPLGAEAAIADVLNPESLNAVVEGVDVVFHCAAAVGNQFSKQDIYRVNLDGVRHTLEACRKNKPRFILISSVNVLGTRNLHNVTEDEPCRYSSDPSADVKIAAEALTMGYHRKYDVPVTIIRPGFIYGPGDPHNLPKLISSLKRGKFKFIGSPDNIIPIVHVDAVIDALIRAAQRSESIGRIYHVLNDPQVTISTFVSEICQVIGANLPDRTLPYWIPAMACKVFAFLKAIGIWRKPGPIAPNSLRFVGTSRSFDLSRARKELGLHFQASLRQELAVACLSHKEHSGAHIVEHATA